MAKDKKHITTFPMRFVPKFSDKIDWYVFHTKSPSKHQYILDAIQEKIDRDKSLLVLEGTAYVENEEAIGS